MLLVGILGRGDRRQARRVVACHDPAAETFQAPRKVPGLWSGDWLDPIFRMILDKLLKT